IGSYLVEGDNLQNSTDSRYHGPISYGLIKGQKYKTWPQSDFGSLQGSPIDHRFF
uniref:Peptidase S26 domain-containing protein n=1 Tax=Sciurus vulgaris TaxID=55149 RepID=A0A8D2JPR7_SCIVU